MSSKRTPRPARRLRRAFSIRRKKRGSFSNRYPVHKSFHPLASRELDRTRLGLFLLFATMAFEPYDGRAELLPCPSILHKKS
jgi:hypothetical protein